MFGDVLYTVGFATILAIIVASLGLFGMATYSIQTRLKEVGIRKVFGSQSKSVALLVGRTFIAMLAYCSGNRCSPCIFIEFGLAEIPGIPCYIRRRHNTDRYFDSVYNRYCYGYVPDA